MKIKLTKEQLDRCRLSQEFSLRNGFYWIVEIDESQIIKEKTNTEKWREIITRVSQCSGSYKEDYVLRIAENYNADAAYKAVCGE